MGPLARRMYRMVLRAYPKEFRHSYGEAMLQTVIDRHRYDGWSWSQLMAREFFDATRVAPLMRWESPMNRIVIIGSAAAVALLAAVAISPVALVPLAVVAIAAVLWWARHDRPIGSPDPARRWSRWVAAGVVALAVGAAIPAIDGGELGDGWWAVFALALLTGTAMTLTGVFLGLNQQTRPPQQRVQ